MAAAPPATVQEAILRLRQALLARDARRATEMVNAYGRLWQRLQRDLEDLAVQAEAGKPREYLEQRVRELQAQIAEQVGQYAAYADGQLEAGVADAIQAGTRDARAIAATAYGPLGEAIMKVGWNALDPTRVEVLVGMLGSDSPLRARMTKRLGEAVAEQVAEATLEGIALGYNPRRIQAEIRRQFGRGLEWSLAQTRTATAYAYREATRASYAANAEMVRGYRRMSALQPTRTCMACVALHGREYALDEPLNDHYNGLCYMEPIMATFAELGLDLPGPQQPVRTGEQWFAGLSDVLQREMMGARAWEEWRAGKFSLRDLASTRADEVYGAMTRETPLKELLRAA